MKRSRTTDNGSKQTRDQELVQRMLHGEETAYRECVDLFKDRLFATLVAQIGCRHEAEEIMQESFIKAFQHLPSFQHQSQLYTWIYRIAWNTSVSRSRKRRRDVSLDSSGAETHSSAPESSEPHIPMERRERITLLRQALSDIEGRHRQILLLREFDELSYQEIADTMKIPLGTVRSRLARARDRLRAELVQIEDRHDSKCLRMPAATEPAMALSH
jgi:RNA polymerase sigma-70 factor (ECF subfamily)